MSESLWDKIVKAAGADYELSLYDREYMLQDTVVFNLIVLKRYRLAIEYWMR
jgi:hypothetical protein